jgi:hypothetical protein
MSNLLSKLTWTFGVGADVAALSALFAQFFGQDHLIVAVSAVAILLLLILTYHVFKSRLIDRYPLLGVFSIALSPLIFVLAYYLFVNTPVRPVEVMILDPQDGITVTDYQYLVRGTISNPNATIYVVVRPLSTPEKAWIQELPTVDAEGNWQVMVYLGNENVREEQDYQISAISSSDNMLMRRLTYNVQEPGETTKLPTNTNRSNIIIVTRAN